MTCPPHHPQNSTTIERSISRSIAKLLDCKHCHIWQACRSSPISQSAYTVAPSLSLPTITTDQKHYDAIASLPTTLSIFRSLSLDHQKPLMPQRFSLVYSTHRIARDRPTNFKPVLYFEQREISARMCDVQLCFSASSRRKGFRRQGPWLHIVCHRFPG